MTSNENSWTDRLAVGVYLLCIRFGFPLEVSTAMSQDQEAREHRSAILQSRMTMCSSQPS